MCGRYGRRADKQRIAEWFQTHNTNVFNDPELAPTYNAAPQSLQPVIRLNSETGEREIALMKWGLVPYWSKTVKLKYSTINADADKLTTSGMWREPFKRRRCLVPADWFYEWPVVDGEKQARAFALKDGSPFAFAGIWDRWKDKDTGEVLESFAIVTVDPSEWMAKYHDRMGIILRPKDYQRCLEEGEEHTLPLDLLRPYPEEEMESWRVSDDVGNTKNNWAELIEPVPDDAPKREKKSKRAKPPLKNVPHKGYLTNGWTQPVFALGSQPRPRFMNTKQRS
jgi:putative SOS response-associated peptidase YedK